METVEKIFLIGKKNAGLLNFKKVSRICVDVYTLTWIHIYI